MNHVPHNRHSRTSRESARRIRPFVKGIALEVLRYMKTQESVNADMIAEHFQGKISENSIRPALLRLLHAELIEKTGYVLPTRTGRNGEAYAVVSREKTAA